MSPKLFNLLTKTNYAINVSSRNYARWSHRHPVRVYRNEEELQSKLKQNNAKSSDILEESLQNAKKSSGIQQINTDENISEIDSDTFSKVKQVRNKFEFDKMKRSDPKLSNLMVTVKSRKKREKADVVLLEGKRLIRDALLANCTLQTILFSRIRELESVKDVLPKDGVNIYQVPYNDLQVWSSLTTCPGIMGIFKTPNISNSSAENKLPVTVVCDNIREPGNLGAIIRCTAATGCEKLILTKGCVELWEPKVLRSAAGAHFRLPIIQKLTWDDIRSNYINKLTGVFAADNKLSGVNLKPVLYDDIRYATYPDILLIIGGETEGVSVEATQLINQLTGHRLYIPMLNNIESLNTGMALAVILYEIQRQLKGYIIDAVKEKIPQSS